MAASFACVDAAFSIEVYPLINSAILDSGTTIHIFNNRSRFLNMRRAIEGDSVWAGDKRLPITGYGEVDIKIRTINGQRRILRLVDVAHCEKLVCNLVSLRQLRKRGFYWDTRQGITTLRRADGSELCAVPELEGQFVLEHIPIYANNAVFAIRRNQFNSWTRRRPRLASARMWHLRLGHPGPEALVHLVNAAEGVRISGVQTKRLRQNQRRERAGAAFAVTKSGPQGEPTGEPTSEPCEGGADCFANTQREDDEDSPPTTVQCEPCALAKMKRQKRRKPRDITQYARGERVALDFHDFEIDYEGYATVLLLTDRVSGYMWDYYLQTRRATEDVITALKDFILMLERQYGIQVKAIECDNEITKKFPGVKQWVESRQITTEPSPAYTQDLNGAAERSGGIIKNTTRAMRIGAKLPTKLWREISKTAVYLLNRTPRKRLQWITPYEGFHSQPGGQRKKPDLAHLRVFGYKAYVMTPSAQKKEKRLKRLQPRAWIGYLLGYDSTNVYRVWVPTKKKDPIVRIRDVIFDESASFSGKIEDMREDIAEMSLDQLSQLLQKLMIPAPEGDQQVQPAEEEPWEVRYEGLGEDEQPVQELGSIAPMLATEAPDESAATSSSEIDRAAELGSIAPTLATEAPDESAATSSSEVGRTDPTEIQDPAGEKTSEGSGHYPTPPQTPPAAMLAAAMVSGNGELEAQAQAASNRTSEKGGNRESRFHYADTWHAAFHAGTRGGSVTLPDGKTLSKAGIERRMRHKKPIYRRELPKPPDRHEDIAKHPMGSWFEQAEHDHLQSHAEMGSWTEISARDRCIAGHKILDCRWVYVYKFDKRGRFVKAKARLVVRGDQQPKNAAESNYAATLAGRSFRTLIAIAARFDLELIQYDAVNAFVNATIDEDIFMRMPPGHRKAGTHLKLNKALYGLRKSPLLWQRELTKTLKALGFQPVPHEPCCFTKDGAIIFFYVDDIVVAFHKSVSREAQEAIDRLKSKYQLTGGHDLQWFLGIEIIRDRKRGLIWLSQSSYIDKITMLVESERRYTTPMNKEELEPFEGIATRLDITMYQRKIGSILYIAVMTRPDIAFATSRLSRYLTNPGPKHHEAVNRVILYLKGTSHLGLKFGGEDDFRPSSDASFADNTLDRKSSQAYAMKLFGGMIGWRANKQPTVTTSTTEAELLALSQTARESMYVSRLISELGVTLDNNNKIVIECDNTQTIRLVTAEIATLKTSLRHVDIHNHWLRQEVQRGTIAVRYTKSAEMLADGLTKALLNDAFERFVRQLGLEDISEQLDERRQLEREREREAEERAGTDEADYMDWEEPVEGAHD